MSQESQIEINLAVGVGGEADEHDRVNEGEEAKFRLSHTYLANQQFWF